ncbi:MAG: hypothetical protein H8Z69_05615 [Nanohaloarchaea archaeon]|nr:hypothetical protein [Candidatus Nanohaloarchaea archaeon]
MGRDLIRLLLPKVESGLKYGERVNVVSINREYSDSALVEVSEDEPNLDWILQAKDVYEMDYKGFVKNIGTDGPPNDRVVYEPSEREKRHRTSMERPKGYTIDGTEEMDLKVTRVENNAVTEDQLPSYYGIISDDYDLSKGRRLKFICHVKNDKVVLGKTRYFYFPKENLMTCDYISVSKPYTRNRVFHETYQFGRRDHPGFEVDEELVCSFSDPSKIMNRLKMNYRKMRDIKQEKNRCWYKRV